MSKIITIVSLILFVSTFADLAAQELPIPAPFQTALKRQTRTLQGTPGPHYWTNHANYIIQAKVNVKTSFLYGEAQITYINNSFDTLQKIVLQLHQNITKIGAMRAFAMKPDDVSDGVTISALSVANERYDLDNAERFRVTNTNAQVSLTEGLKPQESLSISINWQYHIPEKWQLRTGKGDSSSYFVAYWYPKVAVYDDINGWDELPYTGMYEFYNDYGDYDVHVEVDQHYGVWATGQLQNADKVFAPNLLDRWRTYQTQPSQTTQLITQQDYTDQRMLFSNESTTNYWHFRAQNVPDFAFTLSDHYLWDAAHYQRPSGEAVEVHAVYRDEAQDFRKMTALTEQAIASMESNLPGLPFPYPQMTIVQGTNSPSDGGMEFPMMANNPTSEELGRAADIASHEIAHQYFPFMVGTSERHHAWMDEGWAVVLPMQFMNTIDSSRHRIKKFAEVAHYFAGKATDLPLITPTWLLRPQNYFYPSYMKSAMAYYYLRGILGDATFRKCLQTYMAAWQGRHPFPLDFFHTFSEVSNRNLNWYWHNWFYQQNTPNLAIHKVDNEADQPTVQVANLGGLAVPIHLSVSLHNGQQEKVFIPADVWESTDTVSVEVPAPVVEVVLGSLEVPDIHPEDNHLIIDYAY